MFYLYIFFILLLDLTALLCYISLDVFLTGFPVTWKWTKPQTRAFCSWYRQNANVKQSCNLGSKFKPSSTNIDVAKLPVIIIPNHKNSQFKHVLTHLLYECINLQYVQLILCPFHPRLFRIRLVYFCLLLSLNLKS